MATSPELPLIELVTYVPDKDEPILCTGIDAVFPSEKSRFNRYDGYIKDAGELSVSGPFFRPPESDDGTVEHPGLDNYNGLNSLTLSFSGEKSPEEINILIGALAVVLRDMQTKQITGEQ